MARNSSIEWTDHTFNPWWGCSKLSPACAHCYAETWARRVGSHLWGQEAARRFFGDRHWSEPLAWNAEAAQCQTRRRVFCASMADVFEERDDLRLWRSRLWSLIEQTPSLDWLLLTKRPELVGNMVPWKNSWPQNVWLGTTAENQKWLVRRVGHLARYPAIVRFVSCEPLLGALNLAPMVKHLDWVIAGGESGAKARPTHPGWFRSLRDQCISFGISFHFKQWGEWAPVEEREETGRQALRLLWDGREESLERRGKKINGRILDGRTWDDLPNAAGLTCVRGGA